MSGSVKKERWSPVPMTEAEKTEAKKRAHVPGYDPKRNSQESDSAGFDVQPSEDEPTPDEKHKKRKRTHAANVGRIVFKSKAAFRRARYEHNKAIEEGRKGLFDSDSVVVIYDKGKSIKYNTKTLIKRGVKGMERHEMPKVYQSKETILKDAFFLKKANSGAPFYFDATTPIPGRKVMTMNVKGKIRHLHKLTNKEVADLRKLAKKEHNTANAVDRAREKLEAGKGTAEEFTELLKKFEQTTKELHESKKKILERDRKIQELRQQLRKAKAKKYTNI